MSTPQAPAVRTDAVAAWRALPEDTRRWCVTAARDDEPLTDEHLASIVTGYGLAMVRRNRRLLGGCALFAVAAAGALVTWSDSFPQASRGAEALVGAVLLGCVVVVLLRIGPHLRYRTLRFWGKATLERAQIAALPGPDFPEHTTDICFHRARLVAFTAVGWIVVATLSGIAGYRLAVGASPAVGDVALAVVCGLLLLVLVSDLRRQRQYLVDPAFVRLTPQGWELPGTDMRGDWAGVRGIEVLSGRAIGPRRTVHPGMRIIVLRVDDAQRQADNARPSRRREAQADHHQFGSPAVASVGFAFTVSVIEAVTALRRYTAAQIDWR